VELLSPPQEIGGVGHPAMVAGIERKARSQGWAMLLLKIGCWGRTAGHSAPSELRPG
jgi:hypothetical protein